MGVASSRIRLSDFHFLFLLIKRYHCYKISMNTQRYHFKDIHFSYIYILQVLKQLKYPKTKDSLNKLCHVYASV